MSKLKRAQNMNWCKHRVMGSLENADKILANEDIPKIVSDQVTLSAHHLKKALKYWPKHVGEGKGERNERNERTG